MTLTQVSLAANTPQLLFTGPGRVYVAGACFLGADNTVTGASGGNRGVAASAIGTVQLCGNEQLWGVHDSAQSIQVLAWH